MRETRNYNKNSYLRNSRSPRENRSEQTGRAGSSARSFSGKNTSPEIRNKEREKRIKAIKRNSKIFRAAVFGTLGIVIIALLILTLKSCTANNTGENTASSVPSTSPEVSPTVSPEATPIHQDLKSGSALLDRLWAESTEREAEILAAEAEKLRQEEEERKLANTPSEEYAEEKSIDGLEIIEKDSMLIVGDSAYPFYKFDYEAAGIFAAAMNKAPSNVNVYSLITPSKVDIELPLELLNEYPNETSDQRKAIRYINSLLNENITRLYVYDRMKAHCDEELYFKGDSRSTSLASYYAYTLWAEKKGLTPVKLEELSEIVYEDFSGNLSSASSDISASDSIKIYKSDTNFSFSMTTAQGTESWPLYTDVSEYSSSYKYSTFLMALDNYGVITNNDLEDNSACIIVKDENGNSFAPFVAEHYHKTYVVDYRHYSGKLSALIEETGATDIIYYIPIEKTLSTSNASRIDKIS